MRLSEIVDPPYYYSSKDKLDLGSIQTASYSCRLGATYELRLEKVRPVHCLPRDESFYLTNDRDEEASYVYAIQPVGEVHRHHTSWLKRLTCEKLDQVGALDQWTTGYWSGDVIPEDRDAPWELRVAKVKIMKRVGGTEPWTGRGGLVLSPVRGGDRLSAQ